MTSPIRQIFPLGTPPWPTMDPFLFCVHHRDDYPSGTGAMGPDPALLAGRRIGMDFGGRDGWSMYHGDTVPGFPRHPHRGFETVTVTRSGFVDHSDSLGATARYGLGDTQWMTAGSGICHAEMFPLRDQDRDNPMELFQIWLNLPARKKMVAPHFSMLWSETIPRHQVRDHAGRTCELVTVSGAYEGVMPPPPAPNSWAADPENHVAIWTMKMQAEARFLLPAHAAGLNRTLYVFRGGGVRVAGQEVANGNGVLLRSDVEVLLENGAADADVLLLQGRPIGEPVAHHGPFVMNTRVELQQAFNDYHQTQFGGWSFDSSGPVHPREQDRFARLIDGTIDTPSS